MTQTEQSKGVLRRDRVRMANQPALVECGHDAEHPSSSITVIPLLDGPRVAGFQVRCGCGSSAVVECVYTVESSNDPH